MNKPTVLAFVLAVSLSLTFAPAAVAGIPLRPAVVTPITDLIDVVIHNHDVIAIDASAGGGTRRTHLMVGEEVLWMGARGAMGLVVTDKRVLAITTEWGKWTAVHFKVHESRPYSVLLGDRVALVVTNYRAIGVSSSGRKPFQSLIGTKEKVVDGLVSDNVAVVATDRRVLGVSGFMPGIVETRVGVHEDFEYASTLPNFVTIGTDDRVLVFRATTGAWAAERVTLR